MLKTLALQNIRHKKLRTFLASLSISIGTASLLIFMGLSSGIKQTTFEELERQSPLTQITVRPPTKSANLVSFLKPSDESKLSEDDLKTIAKLPDVKAVYPEIQFNNFASIEAELLGFSMITDAMIFGVPSGFIENDINSPEAWNRTTEPYPAIIPSRILDLYNLGIATPRNLPTISEDSLLGKELILYPNYSTFFPGANDLSDSLRLEVVGFSDKVSLLGATLHEEIVRNLNQEYSKGEDIILEIFVETTDATKTQEVATTIENLGFTTEYYQKNLTEVEARFTYLTITLGSIAAVILFTAGIAIISTFLATITERKKEIGLFRALGATKTHIKKIILYEATAIGLFGSIMGILLGFIGTIIINKIGIQQLAQTALIPDSLFNITPQLILSTLLFGILLSVLAAYLPAQKAGNINPIEALSK